MPKFVLNLFGHLRGLKFIRLCTYFVLPLWFQASNFLVPTPYKGKWDRKEKCLLYIGIWIFWNLIDASSTVKLNFSVVKYDAGLLNIECRFYTYSIEQKRIRNLSGVLLSYCFQYSTISFQFCKTNQCFRQTEKLFQF